MAADRVLARSAAAMLAILVAAPGAALAQAEGTAIVPPPIPPVDANDKVPCRRIAITGSLVKAEKVCKTVGEWGHLSDRGNDVVRDQADSMRICSGGDVICRGN